MPISRLPTTTQQLEWLYDKIEELDAELEKIRLVAQEVAERSHNEQQACMQIHDQCSAASESLRKGSND